MGAGGGGGGGGYCDYSPSEATRFMRTCWLIAYNIRVCIPASSYARTCYVFPKFAEVVGRQTDIHVETSLYKYKHSITIMHGITKLIGERLPIQ